MGKRGGGDVAGDDGEEKEKGELEGAKGRNVLVPRDEGPETQGSLK
jgi:hypothetical protein